ncbi:uncharacterized protein LOC123534370 [Mercenaria mercenaria]|uniref:uncharacterized protein LOC123534370 n=1 Tax=Mercenaria mercenaria TaxID=6596 RepID=UPI00234F94C6|nr:uncharacterized protein LOC123534370 [Mercenaria mercenaria]
MRIYNNAGLYSDITSDSVVISLMPEVLVKDGNEIEDIDFVSKPNIIQGSWRYSDKCLIREAHWMIYDSNSLIIKDYQPIISAVHEFYNDELNLQNGRKYFIAIKTIDHLNRTKVGRSDGFTVRIQPPVPGSVRDGKNEEFDYQHSTYELSANWDAFGDTNTNDPTQVIEHYEISIGNDRRYEKTRSNVHFSVNVGLNRSYTFSNLNLTAKLVRYYVTVRGYSKVGGFSESTSNGIRVGFSEAIIPGVILTNQYQSSTKEIKISWKGFYSDLGIRKYSVATSSHLNFITNDTIDCETFENNHSLFDVSKLRDVGINENLKLENLSLQHNTFYYTTVLAYDEAGMCIAVTSPSILVDTTPPIAGKIAVNGMENDDINFATDKTELHFRWSDFVDPESDIKSFEAKLYQCRNCTEAQHPMNICTVISSVDTGTNNIASFYDLQLSFVYTYVLNLRVKNQAQLITSILSPPIEIDLIAPFPGEIYISDTWGKPKFFQWSNTDISGQLAIAFSEDDYVCANQMDLFPLSYEGMWKVPSYNFSSDFIKFDKTFTRLGIGYNSDFTKIIKSGMLNDKFELNTGNYSFVLQAGCGNKVITTVAAVTEIEIIPFTLKDNSMKIKMNSLDESISERNNTRQEQSSIDQQASSNYDNQYLGRNPHGFGIHILGYKTKNKTKWSHVLWAWNTYAYTYVWFDMDINPTDKALNYIISIQKRSKNLRTYVDLKLYINEREMKSIRGLDFVSTAITPAVLTWMEEDFEPPVTDIYSPFYTEAILWSVKIPKSESKACLYGKGFYDPESSIKEIWLGVSSNEHFGGNISPMQLYKTFCYKGAEECEITNKSKCSQIGVGTFELIDLSISGLQLEVIDNTTLSCLNETNDPLACNISSYLLSVKVVNFAGLSTVVHSNPVQIDQTAPTFEYVKCLDPLNSNNEPTDRLGSNSVIGAYWNCAEDISQIEYYSVSITQVSPKENVMNNTFVGLKRRVNFTFGNATFHHGKEYRVIIEATNTAGLKAVDSCQVSVDLFPPNADNIIYGALFAEDEDVDEASEDIPSVTSSQTEIGLTWSGGNNDTRFYQWQVGSETDEDDIFPLSTVADTPKGSVAIVSGHLKIGGKDSNFKVADFVKSGNVTYKEMEANGNKSAIKKSHFMLEPGRCVYQSLYALGWSHLRQKIRSRTICVRRPDDVLLKNISHSVVIASKSMGSNKWKTGNFTMEGSEIVIESKVTNGRLMFGTITEVDKTQMYGSAASTEYQPYITDPKLTASQTSRLLRNRIERFCNTSFFVSPAPFAQVEHMQLNISLRKDCHADTEHQPGLIYWNYVTKEWMHIDEGCRDILSSNILGEVYSAELCLQKLKVLRGGKSSTTDPLTQYRNIELVRIANLIQNTKPFVTLTSIYVKEDEFDPITIPVADKENDSVAFSIAKQPLHSFCKIDDVGILDCKTEADFYGTDEIIIRVNETNVPSSISANVVEQTIKMIILPEEDSTERVFIDNKGNIFREKRPAFSHMITVEANGTDTIFAGTIVLCDVDGNETFTKHVLFSPLGNSTFSINETVGGKLIQNRKFLPTRFRSVASYNITFKFSPNINGHMTLKFIGITANGIFSPSVTIDVYVLANPCVNGYCDHVDGTHTCDSQNRATSFDGFFCHCHPGFNGAWCQDNINECAPEPCALMYDCEDLTNDYRCNINIPKLVAILGCSIIAMMGILLIMRKRCKKFRRNKVSQSSTNLQPGAFEKTYELDSRPLTSSSIEVDTEDHTVEETDSRSHTPNIWRNPNGFNKDKEVDISAFSSLSAPIGGLLPPHHQNKNVVSRYAASTDTGGTPLKVPRVLKAKHGKLRKSKQSHANVHSDISEIDC